MKTVLNVFAVARRGSLSALAFEICRLAVILVGWLPFSTRVNADDTSRPNIVVILVDDLRWDDIGCAGHPFVRTILFSPASRTWDTRQFAPSDGNTFASTSWTA